MHNITIRKYSESDAEAWDKFVQNNSRNGGIFHERKFLSYHSDGKFNDVSAVFEEKGQIIGVFPAALVEANGATKVVSHPGSSNGGLVYEETANLDLVLQMLELLLDYCKGFGATSLEMKIAEPIFNSIPDGELTYLLWHRGFKMSTQEISSCVKLSDYKSWERTCRKRHLYYIRKLEKNGFIANPDANIDAVYQVIHNNLSSKYNKKPTHTLEELKKLKELYPDRIHLWAAEKNETIFAVIVVFTVNKNGVHDFYIARNDAAEDAHALSFLHHKAFEYYYTKGIPWFNFGISSRGDEIKWGILRSKERIGGRATTRQVWSLKNLDSYNKYVYDPAYDLTRESESK